MGQKKQAAFVGNVNPFSRIKQEFWYKYGKRVKYVALFESPSCCADIPIDLKIKFFDVDMSTAEVIYLDEPEITYVEKVGAEKGDRERFLQSVRRARGMVEQYAYCNDWTYFVTLTLNGQRRDRSDLDSFRDSLRQMCTRIRRDTGQAVSYVFVPELHADGVNWHMHGMLNIPASELYQVTSYTYKRDDKGKMRFYDQKGHEIGIDTVKAMLQGREVFIWQRAEKVFGWTTVEKIQRAVGTGVYMCKMFRYMMKMTEDGAEEKQRHVPPWKVLQSGKHLYYCSRGLQKREKISPADGVNVTQGLRDKTYIYENCLIRWYDLQN